ncbi:hypothetical protein C8A05DRAFT_16842 [Staphylotrichum tortipilum]|uniref:Uncharacterized protein n=1 Tax=Staphylotrichum tortipilum TaxID=2831512 RepID=A0AAN6MIU8_9PEZI|nr:hypothetical protein C8A05DRAFT_16842 [Staphylotrichum longicolle]
MFLPRALTAVSLTASLAPWLAWASPIALERRELGGVLICTDPNAQGHCEYAVYRLDTCYNLPPALINNAATFAPDGEAFFCNPYIMKCDDICKSPQGCTMGPVSFDYPHKFNLTAVGWNHYITSFDCHLNRTAAAGQ